MQTRRKPRILTRGVYVLPVRAVDAAPNETCIMAVSSGGQVIQWSNIPAGERLTDRARDLYGLLDFLDPA